MRGGEQKRVGCLSAVGGAVRDINCDPVFQLPHCSKLGKEAVALTAHLLIVLKQCRPGSLSRANVLNACFTCVRWLWGGGSM